MDVGYRILQYTAMYFTQRRAGVMMTTVQTKMRDLTLNKRTVMNRTASEQDEDGRKGKAYHGHEGTDKEIHSELR